MALTQPRGFVGQGRGVSHHGQENKTSTNRPDTLTQTFVIHQLFPCSRTADHTLTKFNLSDPNFPIIRLERSHFESGGRLRVELKERLWR
jgi:hypothetical protein